MTNTGIGNKYDCEFSAEQWKKIWSRRASRRGKYFLDSHIGLSGCWKSQSIELDWKTSRYILLFRTLMAYPRTRAWGLLCKHTMLLRFYPIYKFNPIAISQSEGRLDKQNSYSSYRYQNLNQHGLQTRLSCKLGSRRDRNEQPRRPLLRLSCRRVCVIIGARAEDC